MFHGTMRRHNSGHLRKDILMLAKGLPNASIWETRLPSTPGENTPKATEFMYRTALTYQNSRFCFVPEGDSHTSRRLFDTLAAGCIPVTFARDCLPFLRDVNYSKITLDAGDLVCCKQHQDKVEGWFKRRFRAPADPSDESYFQQMACRGSAVYKDALNHWNGAATNSLLRHFRIL